MNARIFIAPTLILLLDAAPAVVQVDTSGTKARVSVGLSTARYEHKRFGCNGELLSVDPVEFNAAGGRLDMMHKAFRFTGFGGNITSHPDEEDHYEGAFLGFLAAAEGERGGIGAGAVKINGSDEVLAPTFYLRMGPIRTGHFRFELFPPSEVFGNTGWFRVGAGFNQGLDPGRHGFVGVGFGPYGNVDSMDPLLIADVGWPATEQFDFLTYFQVGRGEDRMQWSLGAGVALNLGAIP